MLPSSFPWRGVQVAVVLARMELASGAMVAQRPGGLAGGARAFILQALHQDFSNCIGSPDPRWIGSGQDIATLYGCKQFF